jgi:hypothetical protein
MRMRTARKASTELGTDFQKLMGGGGHSLTDTQRAWWSHKPTFIFQDKESRLEMVVK